MKRKILFAAAFVFIAWAATSCEDLEKCKYCRLVSTDSSNGEVTEGFETEYCGAKLVAIEAIGPKTVGTVTTEYVCR
jgi:hypothetical protein